MAEKKLLTKLQEAEEAVADGTGWLSLDELKSAMNVYKKEITLVLYKVKIQSS